MTFGKPSQQAVALIELVVVLLVAGIVATTAVLVIGGMHTKPASHACWDEAEQFQQLVRNYERRHHAPPGLKESKTTPPGIAQVALAMLHDDKGIDQISAIHSGDA